MFKTTHVCLSILQNKLNDTTFRKKAKKWPKWLFGLNMGLVSLIGSKIIKYVITRLENNDIYVSKYIFFIPTVLIMFFVQNYLMKLYDYLKGKLKTK